MVAEHRLHAGAQVGGRERGDAGVLRREPELQDGRRPAAEDASRRTRRASSSRTATRSSAAAWSGSRSTRRRSAARLRRRRQHPHRRGPAGHRGHRGPRVTDFTTNTNATGRPTGRPSSSGPMREHAVGAGLRACPGSMTAAFGIGDRPSPPTPLPSAGEGRRWRPCGPRAGAEACPYDADAIRVAKSEPSGKTDTRIARRSIPTGSISINT